MKTMIILSNHTYEPKKKALDLLQGFGLPYADGTGLNLKDGNHACYPVTPYKEKTGM